LGVKTEDNTDFNQRLPNYAEREPLQGDNQFVFREVCNAASGLLLSVQYVEVKKELMCADGHNTSHSNDVHCTTCQGNVKM
jgi:hypothetical protein